MTPGAQIAMAIEVLEAIAAAPRKPADAVLADYLRGRRFVGAKDRRAVAEMAYGVLRRRARLDWHLLHAGAAEPNMRLRVLGDRALSESMSPEDLGKLAGPPHGFPALSQAERGILAQLQGAPKFHHGMPDWVRGEYPEWIEPLLREAYGPRLAEEMGHARDEAPVDLRVNTLKADREQAIAALLADKVQAVPTVLSPIGLRLPGRVTLRATAAFREGLVEVQDEGSQLVGLLVGAAPGMAVADFCSGGGGKTLAMAAMMENKGRLVACDTNAVRMERGQERFRRAGVHNVTRHVLGTEGDKWIKRQAGGFDRVLVDAPCTGTGTWRRNPDAKWTLTERDLAELREVQASILNSASRLVKPGGQLVYATCSVLREENEMQIEAFLARNTAFRSVPVGLSWERHVGTPMPAMSGDALRLSPAANGTDGFFAAILERGAG